MASLRQHDIYIWHFFTQNLPNFANLFRLQRPRVDEEADEHLRYLHGRDHHCD